MKYRFLLIFLNVLCINIYAQEAFSGDSASRNYLFHAGIRAHYGFIFAHSRDVSNLAQSYPVGVELNLSRRLISRKTWDNCRCFPHAGILVSFVDYDNAIVGRSITAAPYLEPVFRLSGGIQLAVRGGFGLSYLTNPYDPVRNPANQSYSLPVSGFLVLGTGLHLKVTEQLWLNLTGQYNHISNGGIKEPNKGVNYPTASLGFHYYPQKPVLPTYPDSGQLEKGKRDLRIEVYGASKTILPGEKQRFGIGGLHVSAGWRIGRINRLRAGVEWTADYALKENLRRAGADTRQFHRAGLMAGNEFVMGKFLFSQQMAVYVYNPSRYNTLLYQRYGLLYQFHPRWTAGVSLKAHGHVANFIDFRVGYAR
jgi:hypothetical protein